MKHTQITSVRSVWIMHYGTHACSAWCIAASREGWKVGRMFNGRWTVQSKPNLEVEAEKYVQSAARADGMIAIPAKDGLLTALAHAALHEPWVEFEESGR